MGKAKDEVIEKFIVEEAPTVLNAINMKEDLINYLCDLARDEFEEKVDRLLDKVEDDAKESETKWDDILVLPLCKIVREILQVPDED